MISSSPFSNLSDLMILIGVVCQLYFKVIHYCYLIMCTLPCFTEKINGLSFNKSFDMPIEHVNSIPTTQFFTGISIYTPSKSYLCCH